MNTAQQPAQEQAPEQVEQKQEAIEQPNDNEIVEISQMQKEPVERQYDPQKIAKKQSKLSPEELRQKRNQYQKTYRERLKERATNGDEKAKEMIEKKKISLLNMENKYKELKKAKPAPIQASEPKPIEPEIKEATQTQEVDTSHLVPKEKYKKLKARVTVLQDEVDKIKTSTKPKYNQNVYNALFGKLY